MVVRATVMGTQGVRDSFFAVIVDIFSSFPRESRFIAIISLSRATLFRLTVTRPNSRTVVARATGRLQTWERARTSDILTTVLSSKLVTATGPRVMVMVATTIVP